MVDIQQLEAQLSQSINQYDRILTLLQRMDREIGTASPTELQDMDKSLTELQRQATEIDQSFLGQLTVESTKPEAIGSLLDKRASVVQEIILLNGNISTKAMGVKTLLAHEIGTIHSGLSALKGYKKQVHNQGRIVNSTS
ncbi:MAG: hypothetical protein ACD_75C02645G0006 [uncultured bacterium]|nr:MAG: hypothetical protein ACD_75C02645G0006 [uncultured bacterium]